jgi:hypothetical protein
MMGLLWWWRRVIDVYGNKIKKKKNTISITQNLDENGLHTNTKIQDFITKYFFLSSLLK